MALITVAAFVAAAINAVAGGGSLLSFPALLVAGYSALTANITNTVGLVAGYAGGSLGYRRELGGQSQRIVTLGTAGSLGAILGAFLLTRTPAQLFQAIVPWLILTGCALLAAQPAAGRLMTVRRARPEHRGPFLVAVTFVAGVYAAFFGAGLGVVLLAVLAIFIDDGLQRLNALKGVLSLLFNVVAAVYFVVFAPVAWQAVAVMLPAGFLGGFAGVAVARRLPSDVLRIAVVAFGIAVAIRLLL
ncbi:MAG: sulfite exporter TauE/SafE family protein [Candidatus Dormibacteraeota bacterium]|nr:sulfite exporter TauE/SafE family protein [Candidatus Dormibacteraeota bacterium]